MCFITQDYSDTVYIARYRQVASGIVRDIITKLFTEYTKTTTRKTSSELPSEEQEELCA